jgi:hypothetical protein
MKSYMAETKGEAKGEDRTPSTTSHMPSASSSVNNAISQKKGLFMQLPPLQKFSSMNATKTGTNDISHSFSYLTGAP